jgi:hypothetical protein
MIVPSQPMSPTVSRIAALGLLAGVLAAAYALVIEPISRRIGTALDRIATERTLLARLDQAAVNAAAKTSARAAADQLAGATGNPPLSALVLDGESEAVMAARLQSVVQSAAGRAEGVRISSTRSLPPRERDGLRLIGLEVRCTASLEAAQKLLIGLEGSRPLVLIEVLQLTPASPRSGSDETPRIDVFDVRIELYGAAGRGSKQAEATGVEPSKR